MRRILMWSVGTIAVIILALYLSSSLIATRLLRHTLAKNPVKGYVVDFESLHVNVLLGDVVLRGFTLEPAAGVKDSLGRSAMYLVKVGKINANNIGILDLLRKKVLDADLVEAEQASLCLLRPARNDTLVNIPELDVAIDDLYMVLPDSSGFQPGAVRFNDLRMSVVTNYMGIPGGMYELVKGSLTYSYTDSLLNIDSIRLAPLYGKYEFGRKVGKQTDRIVFSVDRIAIEGIDLPQILFAGDLTASRITIEHPVFEVFRDKVIPLDMNHFPKLYHRQLKEMRVGLSVDSILIKGGQVRYEEHSEGAAEAGYIVIDDLDAAISNLTNDSAAIAGNETIEVHAAGMLNRAAKAHLDISMPLNEPNYRFYFSGRLEDMDLTALNTITRDNARVEILSGRVDKLEFHAIANNDNSTGTMRMLYDNLELNVLKANDPEYHPNNFLSGLANMVVIKKNPPNNKSERIGMMSYERDRNKGFFNYLVKTIFSGASAIALPGRKNLANGETAGAPSGKKKSQK